MKLEFGILWIEDNYTQSEEDSLRRVSRAVGFDLSIEHSINGKDIEYWSKQQNMYHLFDLILLDLTLSDDGDENGVDVAIQARQLFHFTPILFYSGNKSANELRTMMANQNVEGVFCASRDDFIDRAGEIITSYSTSLNRLSGMRGLAMEVVAQIDEICKSIILRHQEHFDIKRLDDDVNQSISSMKDKYGELSDIETKLESRAVDSQKLFKQFRRILESVNNKLPEGEQKDHFNALRKATSSYSDDVLKIRNTLGHALEEKTDSGWQILDGSGEVIMTVNDFPGYRDNFMKQLEAFKEIQEYLGTENSEQ